MNQDQHVQMLKEVTYAYPPCDRSEVEEALDPIVCPHCFHRHARVVDVYRPARFYLFNVGRFQGQLIRGDSDEESASVDPNKAFWTVDCNGCNRPFAVASCASPESDWGYVLEAFETRRLLSLLVEQGYAIKEVETGDLLPGDVVDRSEGDTYPDAVVVTEVLGPAAGQAARVSALRVVVSDGEVMSWPGTDMAEGRLWRAYRPPLLPPGLDEETVDLIRNWKSQKKVVRGWVVDHLRARFVDDAVTAFVSAIDRGGPPVWHLLSRPSGGGGRAGLDL